MLFYLSLMNLGISVLLVGNPLAFEHLRAFSQVVRRFSTGGMHRLKPASSRHDPWWAKDLVPRIRKFSLVDEVALDPDVWAEFEFKHTAGIPGLLQVLHIEAQRSALRRAQDGKAILDFSDLQAALASPNFSTASVIAEQVQSKGHSQMRMSDIPTDQESGSSESPSELVAPGPMTVSALKAMVNSFQSARTRELTRFKQRLDSVSGMSEDELQVLGVTTDLLNEVKIAQSALERERSGRGKRSGPNSKAVPKPES